MRTGLTDLFKRLGPYGMPPPTHARDERSVHKSGGRARGRRADAEVGRWVKGGACTGDARRVKIVLDALHLTPVKTQVLAQTEYVRTFVDMLAVDSKGVPVAVELKVGFADRFDQPLGGTLFGLELTAKTWASIQAACGALMLGHRRALVIRILDTKATYTAIDSRSAVWSVAKKVLASAASKSLTQKTTRRK